MRLPRPDDRLPADVRGEDGRVDGEAGVRAPPTLARGTWTVPILRLTLLLPDVLPGPGLARDVAPTVGEATVGRLEPTPATVGLIRERVLGAYTLGELRVPEAVGRADDGADGAADPETGKPLVRRAPRALDAAAELVGAVAVPLVPRAGVEVPPTRDPTAVGAESDGMRRVP